MKLDWNKIVSNAVTVLVASVFMGAAVKLWSGVETIDDRISDNLTSIRATQNILAPKVDRIEDELEKLMVLIESEMGEEETTSLPLVSPQRPNALDLINQDFMQQKTIQQIGPR